MVQRSQKNDPEGSFFLTERFGLDNPSFLECLVCAVLCDGLEASGRYADNHRFVNFGYKNTLLQDVGLATCLPCRVEFSRTRTVAVAACHL